MNPLRQTELHEQSLARDSFFALFFIARADDWNRGYGRGRRVSFVRF